MTTIDPSAGVHAPASAVSPTSNTELERAVRRGLLVDPRARDAQEVAISADGGFVTLSGTVETFQQKRAIGKAAASVAGVSGVANTLRTRPASADLRAHDCTLRAVVLQALLWNSAVPDEQISVEVSNGCVRVTGEVDLPYEADAAYETVADLVGVVDVTTDIRVTGAARDAADLIDRTNAALNADRKSTGEGILVRAWRGEVTLTGTLPSLEDHDAALAAVWAVPGVVSVCDRLSVDAARGGD